MQNANGPPNITRIVGPEQVCCKHGHVTCLLLSSQPLALILHAECNRGSKRLPAILETIEQGFHDRDDVVSHRRRRAHFHGARQFDIPAFADQHRDVLPRHWLRAGAGRGEHAAFRSRDRRHGFATHHRSRDARVALCHRFASARAAHGPHLDTAATARRGRDGLDRRPAHRLCVYVLGFSWGPSLLLAAMLAPTDPVLAHDVQVEKPGDIDLLRFSLTGEGGLNDGIALPFALLGIAVCRFEASPAAVLHWSFALQALWGIAGALGSGWFLGELAVRLVAYLRTRHGQALGPEGFYALGLIALSYGVAELLHTYAFLAVFAAGLAMRRVEQKASGDKSAREAVGTIDADDVGATASDPARAHAFMAERVHGFTIELERIAEVAIMLMVGAVLATIWRELFTWQAALLIGCLFFVARPLSVEASLIGSGAHGAQRRLMSWFGIRGVGSFYYLLYAIEQAPKDVAKPLVPLVIAVIVASVIIHGVTATPLMKRYQRVIDQA